LPTPNSFKPFLLSFESKGGHKKITLDMNLCTDYPWLLNQELHSERKKEQHSKKIIIERRIWLIAGGP
jgi:hypothetical protein